MRSIFASFIVSLMLASAICLVSTEGAYAREATPQTAQWDKTLTQLHSIKDKTEKEAELSKALVKQSKAELIKQLQELRQLVQQKQNAFEASKKTYQGLIKSELELKELLKDKSEEIKTFEGTVRTAATHVKELSSVSFLTPFRPDRKQLFQTLLTPDRMPGAKELQTLIETCFEELEATGTVGIYQSEIIDSKGNLTNAQIFRNGTASAIYQTSTGENGFLSLTNQGHALKSITGLSKALHDQISQAFTGSTILPLDFSHGAAFVKLNAEKDLWQRITDGGLLVWPILGIGALALLLGLERLFMMLRVRRYPESSVASVLQAAKEGDWDTCRSLLQQKATPTSRVLLCMLSKASSSNAALEKSMDEAILHELPRMERFLPTLQILAAVAPLLGLLGTVTGMINTFQVITLFGTGDPHMLSGGISEALVTTQLGLAVAIPIMMLHHVLNSRVDRIVGEMEEKGTALIATIAGSDRKDA